MDNLKLLCASVVNESVDLCDYCFVIKKFTYYCWCVSLSVLVISVRVCDYRVFGAALTCTDRLILVLSKSINPSPSPGTSHADIYCSSEE